MRKRFYIVRLGSLVKASVSQMLFLLRIMQVTHLLIIARWSFLERFYPAMRHKTCTLSRTELCAAVRMQKALNKFMLLAIQRGRGIKI